MAPVLTSPAVATTQTGRKPAARSMPICEAKARTFIWNVSVTGTRHDRIAADAEHRRGLADRHVRHRRGVDPRLPRKGADAALVQIDVRARPQCDGESGEVGQRAAAQEHAHAIGSKPDQLFQPLDHLMLDRRRSRRRSPGGDVLVHRRGQQIAHHAGEARGRLHVAEHPRMAVVAAEVSDALDLRHHLRNVLRVEWQRARETRGEILRACGGIDGQGRLGAEVIQGPVHASRPSASRSAGGKSIEAVRAGRSDGAKRLCSVLLNKSPSSRQ